MLDSVEVTLKSSPRTALKQRGVESAPEDDGAFWMDARLEVSSGSAALVPLQRIGVALFASSRPNVGKRMECVSDMNASIPISGLLPPHRLLPRWLLWLRATGGGQ